MPSGIYIRTKEYRNKLSQAHKGHIVVEETRKKIGLANKGKYHIAWNKGLTKEIDERIKKYGESGSKQKRGKTYEQVMGKERAKARKKVLSEAQSKNIMNGWTAKSCYKRGYFYSEKNQKSLHYRSSWELQKYQELEQDSNVLKYEPECLKIPYEWEGSTHNYVPDILVTYLDNSRELVEIKPDYLLEDKQTICKIKAGKEYALEKGIKFSIWNNQKI